jgi:uncharacterized protein YcfJ
MNFFRFEKLGSLPRFSTAQPRRCRGASRLMNASTLMNAFGALLFATLLFGLQVSAQERPAQERPAQERALGTAAAAAESTHYGWADVLRVDPVFEDGTASAPQQECYEEQVLQPAQASESDDGKRVGGTIFGAIIGGVLGNRFGKGDGRKAATAAGAVAGGVVGNNLASGNSGGSGGPPRYTTQRRCRQVDSGGPRHVVGYDVEYRYRGELYTARMVGDPGDRIRVRVSVTPAE